jgi:hypothetical protein
MINLFRVGDIVKYRVPDTSYWVDDGFWDTGEVVEVKWLQGDDPNPWRYVVKFSKSGDLELPEEVLYA